MKLMIEKKKAEGKTIIWLKLEKRINSSIKKLFEIMLFKLQHGSW